MKKKERHKKMFVIIGILLILIGGTLIWFHIPYSPVKSDFQRDVLTLTAENSLPDANEIIKSEDFSHLPMVIQKYIEHCGYIGMPKMSYLKMEYHNVIFKQSRKSGILTINYTQYDFAQEPSRLALIDSAMFGIPFEGYDYYQNGTGGMKGIIAKVIPLFDQTGEDMNKACLVTYLAESMFAPTILLQGYITFDQFSEYEVKATITYGGQTASGIFTFNKYYEMISFTTNDRGVIDKDGTIEYVPWSALCGEYKTYANGIKYPTKFQAVWNYPDENFVYFDGTISEVSYGC